jgi:hypothetical protein
LNETSKIKNKILGMKKYTGLTWTNRLEVAGEKTVTLKSQQ